MSRQEKYNGFSRRDLFKFTGSACLIAAGVIGKDAVDKATTHTEHTDADYETRKQQALETGGELVAAALIVAAGYVAIDHATK